MPMAEGVPSTVWAYRALFAVLALALLFLRLLPLGSVAGAWPGPDLLMCLTFAWVLRRPDYVPLVLIALVVLLEDLLLMRPPGLWAALMVLGAEFLRNRTSLTRELSFVVEWVLVAGVMAAVVMGNRLVLAVTMLDQPSLGQAIIQLVASILCYPVVIFLSRLAFGVRKPAAGEIDAYGRRL
jgi:rod shape-determining protein MreD